MKKANLAHWIVSTSSLGIAAASLALFLRAPRPKGELVLQDESGRARLRLIAADKVPRIELLDEQGHIRTSLGQEQRGISLQFFRQGSSKAAIELLVPDEPTGPLSYATITAFSPDGKRQASVGAGNDAWFWLSSTAGNIRLSHTEERSEIGASYVDSSIKLNFSQKESVLTTTKPLWLGIASSLRLYPPTE